MAGLPCRTGRWSHPGSTRGLDGTTAARRHAYTTEEAANDPHHHTRLGVAYANLDATRLLFYRAVAAAEDSVLDEDANAMVRVRNRRDYAHVARSCTHIAEAIFLASGARSLSISGHLQRQRQQKRMWFKNITFIEGEEPSPFVVAVIVGEATSLVTNWGTEGIHFINADVTITLGRLPTSREIGIEADNHISSNGVAACSGTLYDRDGMLGTSVAVALANSRRRIQVDESSSQ